tara:strand:- start:11593 stop:11853 length:261 start_codon:yes stop_codon:yes gene_type:complete
MSSYVCHLPPISYFDFKIAYYKEFPNSSYRLGQAFINCFIKKEDQRAEFLFLWEEKNVNVAENLIFRLIRDWNWDMMALVPVRKSL